MQPVNVTMPLKTVSEANVRGHWAKKARRAAEQRQVVLWGLCQAVAPLRGTQRPLRVLLVRVGPRMLDDDNVRGALKAVRDGVADALGRDDADPGIVWDYKQERGPYGVRIEVTRG